MNNRITNILVAYSLAWAGCAAEGTRVAPEQLAPEVYYLHVYSPLYDVLTDGLGVKSRAGNNRRLASLAISPGVEFYLYTPNYYEPEIEISGQVKRSGDLFNGSLKIFVQGVDVAFGYEQSKPVQLDELVDWNGLFYFAITRQPDPYSIDYKVEWEGTARQIR